MGTSIFLMLQIDGKPRYAKEILYFFIANDIQTAAVSLYGPPNTDILKESYSTAWACQYTQYANIKIIPVYCIISVVSMQPLPKAATDDKGTDLWFVVEKSGLGDIKLTGYSENIPDNDND
ncbi:hypothetical protein FA15DRAFT_662224 [Coprinopsis marcescibilis]|uniref:Uncharacterized protein n=1 Tax=Coprinopsis marcescibilis TaxID=230819 RepID=A0A5C3K8Y1_COPMA|nr:hypothetical protein FA15DRAFT_662224 [Coprinopsis marcescibilis]